MIFLNYLAQGLSLDYAVISSVFFLLNQLNIIYLSDIVGVDALTVPNTTTGDVSAEIETSSGGKLFY